MRATLLLLLAGLSGCFIIDRDGDGTPDKSDCAPGSRLTSCPLDTGTPGDSDAPPDTAPPDSGDSLPPETGCEPLVWYRDADLDGYGDPAVTTEDCAQPDGYVADATDCSDGDATSYPGAPERCDGADNDCDGTADEALSGVWYVDADGDGYGYGDGIDVVCDGNSGELVDNAEDCDDGNAFAYPGAIETCDGADNDCDGSIDDDAIDATDWYVDADRDGYGDPAARTDACDAPAGAVDNDDDCDDLDGSVNPAAGEQCNGVDDNCDGSLSGVELDGDLDGVTECDGDCEGSDPAVYPGATESCNGTDDDCDGSVDESDASDAGAWYYDADGDGYGDGAAYAACDSPRGYAATDGDCDDTDGTVYPGALEYCDGADNDCNGVEDDGAVDATVWSLDADGDGYGDSTYASWVDSCEQPSGYVPDFEDCDDADGEVSPAAAEVYGDGLDNDCNGTVDDSGIFCCLDDDGDGWGTASTCVYEETGACSLADYVPGDSDCDDTNASVNPDAYEALYDTVDANCNGSANN